MGPAQSDGEPGRPRVTAQFPRYVCIHGHFYQPPRENPWLEAIEVQDSAAPFHDWNERITRECYAPNTRSRLVDGQGRIVNLRNNYACLSFNLGPTLLSWMAETAVDTPSLEALAAAGLRFTVLAPRQARRWRKVGAREWSEGPGGIDPSRAYRCKLPSGKSIALFFYDGLISQQVAFERLLDS